MHLLPLAASAVLAAPLTPAAIAHRGPLCAGGRLFLVAICLLLAGLAPGLPVAAATTLLTRLRGRTRDSLPVIVSIALAKFTASGSAAAESTTNMPSRLARAKYSRSLIPARSTAAHSLWTRVAPYVRCARCGVSLLSSEQQNALERSSLRGIFGSSNLVVRSRVELPTFRFSGGPITLFG